MESEQEKKSLLKPWLKANNPLHPDLILASWLRKQYGINIVIEEKLTKENEQHAHSVLLKPLDGTAHTAYRAFLEESGMDVRIRELRRIATGFMIYGTALHEWGNTHSLHLLTRIDKMHREARITGNIPHVPDIMQKHFIGIVTKELERLRTQKNHLQLYTPSQ